MKYQYILCSSETTTAIAFKMTIYKKVKVYNTEIRTESQKILENILNVRMV